MLQAIRTRQIPPAAGGATGEFDALDDARLVLWSAVRRLFPPHARVCQLDSGSLQITWCMRQDPHARAAESAPVLLQLERDLVLALWTSNLEERRAIAQRQAGAVRAGLFGYDPYDSGAVPSTRVIVLG